MAGTPAGIRRRRHLQSLRIDENLELAGIAGTPEGFVAMLQ